MFAKTDSSLSPTWLLPIQNFNYESVVCIKCSLTDLTLGFKFVSQSFYFLINLVNPFLILSPTLDNFSRIIQAIICNRRTTPTWALLLLRIWHTSSRRNAVWRIIRQTSNSLAKEHNQTHFYYFTTPLSPSVFDELKNSVFPPRWLAPVQATSPTWSPPPLCKQALRQVKESNRSRQRHKLGTRQNSFGLIRRAYTEPQWKDARREAVDKRYCIQAIPLWARRKEKNDIWGIRLLRPKQASKLLEGYTQKPIIQPFVRNRARVCISPCSIY